MNGKDELSSFKCGFKMPIIDGSFFWGKMFSCCEWKMWTQKKMAKETQNSYCLAYDKEWILID